MIDLAGYEIESKSTDACLKVVSAILASNGHIPPTTSKIFAPLNQELFAYTDNEQPESGCLVIFSYESDGGSYFFQSEDQELDGPIPSHLQRLLNRCIDNDLWKHAQHNPMSHLSVH